MRGVYLPSQPYKSPRYPPPILEARYRWILLKDGRTALNRGNRSDFMHTAAFGGFNLLRLSFLRKFNPIQRGGTRPIWAPIMRRSWLNPVFPPQSTLRRSMRRATAWSQSLLRRVSLLHRSFLRSSTLV